MYITLKVVTFSRRPKGLPCIGFFGFAFNFKRGCVFHILASGNGLPVVATPKMWWAFFVATKCAIKVGFFHPSYSFFFRPLIRVIPLYPQLLIYKAPFQGYTPIYNWQGPTLYDKPRLMGVAPSMLSRSFFFFFEALFFSRQDIIPFFRANLAKQIG